MRPEPQASLIRKVSWGAGAVLVAVLGGWWLAHEQVPRVVRLASAEPGGLYHHLAELLESRLEQRLGRRVTIETTAGSAVNRQRLLRDQAHLAIVQTGAVTLEGLVIVAPLYDDVVHLVVRRGSGIDSILGLEGRRVALGRKGSGHRATAEQVLDHYGVSVASLDGNDAYFSVLADDPTYDAAVVTTGLLNPDLEHLLRSQAFDLQPIEDGDAFAVRHPLFAPFALPRGLYAEAPPVPDRPTPTVATTAVLAARADVHDALVRGALESLYETDLRSRVPTLWSAAQAASWDRLPLHAVARRYFDPYGGLDLIASFTESLAAIKELLFAFGAGIWLLWSRRRHARAKVRDRALSAMKERLDSLLDRTAEIERAQMNETEPDVLRAMLDQVTEIKLEALDELTHEDLRGDRQFLIFLIQCGNLMDKIQAKLALRTS